MLDTNDALSERSRGRRTHGSRAGAETEEEEQDSSRAQAETRGAQQDGSSAGTASPEPGTTCTTCTAARTASPTAAQPETAARPRPPCPAALRDLREHLHRSSPARNPGSPAQRLRQLEQPARSKAEKAGTDGRKDGKEKTGRATGRL